MKKKQMARFGIFIIFALLNEERKLINKEKFPISVQEFVYLRKKSTVEKSERKMYCQSRKSSIRNELLHLTDVVDFSQTLLSFLTTKKMIGINDEIIKFHLQQENFFDSLVSVSSFLLIGNSCESRYRTTQLSFLIAIFFPQIKAS